MLQSICVNLNALEYMNFFWQSVMDREKVGESYIASVAELPEMAVLYDEEFDAASVRKALSAITNKELLSEATQKTKRFWGNNMRVTEDRELLEAMISPIKTLSPESMKEKLNRQASIPYETIEVVFIPAATEDCFQKADKLYINFFKVMVDVFGGTGEVTIAGQPPYEYICGKILAMDGVLTK